MSIEAIVFAALATLVGVLLATVLVVIFGIGGEGLVDETDLPGLAGVLPWIGFFAILLGCLVAPALLIWPSGDPWTLRSVAIVVVVASLAYLVTFGVGYGGWTVLHDWGAPGRARRAIAPPVAISRWRRLALLIVWVPVVGILPVALFFIVIVIGRP